ncbi:MAG: hypothetical protein ACOCRX_07680 [Candidatus Woesearchaeota archaeon]
MSKEYKKELIASIFGAIILTFIAVVTPSVIGFAAGGFDTQEVLDQYQLYAPYALAGIFIMLFAVILEFVIRKEDDKYGNGVLFFSPGSFPSFKAFKSYSSFQIFLFSLIVFSFLGFLQTATKQQTFTGIATLQQQFTEIGSISFSSALVPIAENLPVASAVALFLVMLRFYGRKYDLSKGNFRSLALFGSIGIFVFLGVANHLLRYSGQDVAVFIVAGFWGVMGLLTFITGSVIPALIMHFSNNFFFDLKRFFSSDTVFIWASSIIVLLTLLYFYLYREDMKWLKGAKYNKGGS